MQKVYKLTGVIQNYQWGGTEFIPELIGIQNTNNKPCAELWLGAHHKGMAQVRLPSGAYITLKDFIDKNPSDVLGKKAAEIFDNKLPFLLKILDVKSMLSIQCHPTKMVAEEGFKKENKVGVPLMAANRTYRDANHKPEVMIALGEFWLLHGFKSSEKISQTLFETPELHVLQPYFENQDIKKLYTHIMTMTQKMVNKILLPLKKRITPLFKAGEFKKTSENYWATQAFDQHAKENGDIDRGVFSIYLMNIVSLKKDEGIYQPAGMLHAYLEGQNIELMASSDNVFRGGLTQKHINVPGLLKNIITKSIAPVILKGIKNNLNEFVYQTNADDFEVSKIVIQKSGLCAQQNKNIAIYLVINGEIKITSDDFVLNIKKGEAFLSRAGVLFNIQSLSRGAEICKASI